MAKHSEQNTTLEQEIPVVIENAPAGQIPAGDIVANPPKPITRTGEIVQVKPTKAGPFKIGPKYWRFTVNTVYSVPNYVKQVLSRANALGVI